MIEIYSVSNYGDSLGKSINAPNDDSWRVIYFLRFQHRSTIDQIAEHLGKSRVATSIIMRKLQKHNPPIVLKEGNSEV